MQKNKLFIIIIIITTLVLGILIWFWGQKTETDMEKTIEGQYGEMEIMVAENIATIMESMVSNLTSQLKIIANIPSIQNIDPKNCNLILEQTCETLHPRIYNLARVSKNGLYECSTEKEIIGRNAIQFAQIVEVLKTQKPTVSRKFRGVNGEWLIVVYVPVFTADGKFDGSLGGAINLKDIYENYLKDNVFTQRGYVIMVDDNGDYLYHPNSEIATHNAYDEYMTKVLAESKALQDLVKDFLAGKTGIMKYIYLKEWKLAAYTPAQIAQDRFWAITITVPLTEIQSPIKSVVIRFQYMSFTALIFLALLFSGMIILLLRWTKILDKNVLIRTQDLENANIAVRNILEDLGIEKSKLETAKAKDEAILSSIGDGIIAINSDKRIIVMNIIAEELLGWKVEEAIGRFYDEIIFLEDKMGTFVPSEERPFAKALISSTTTTTTTTTTSFYLRSKNKIKFPVAITVSPIIANNKIIGAVEVFRDITKEKAVDKAKSEFVSLASHQLRTPLSTINWYSEMLLSLDVGKLTPKQRQYSQEVYHASQRMVSLVNALLNVSRLELGTFTVEPEITDIVKIAKMCLKELAQQILEKKLIVNQKYDDNVSSVNIDPKLMAIIFQNLLSNSVKYSNIGGKIDLTISRKKDTILITVSDNGIGIPVSQQKNIFQKLFRADNAKIFDPSGSGLGLYIVKEIMDNSGGKVWFESSEENGTIFNVNLPLSGMVKKTGSKKLI